MSVFFATPRLTWSAALAASLAFLYFAGSASAAVTSVGAVSTTSGQLVIGNEQAPGEDTRGWYRVDDGTQLLFSTLIVGDEELYDGELHVVGDFIGGAPTQLTFAGASLSNATARIGNEGTGRVDISGGATMILTHSTSEMVIGVESTGVGSVTVRDPFTIMALNDELVVGGEGIGRLDVLDGALVHTIDDGSNDGVIIGQAATSVGTVVVDGAGSVLRVGRNLTVGGLGLGSLTIGEGSIVDVDDALTGTITPTVTVGGGGRLMMNGGTLVGAATTVNGYMGGSGLVRGTVGVGADAFVETGSGDLLRFVGDVSNQGAITIDHGEIDFQADFTNNAIGAEPAPGRITLENGTVRFSQTMVNDGVISSAQGYNNIHGEITNQGEIVVASESVATFSDSVTAGGGGTITVLARGNALFLTDVTFTATGAIGLSVGLDNMTDNTGQLGIAGAAALDGDINVGVDANYTPMLGESFELISAAGGITGTFATETLPTIGGGLEFGLIYNPTNVRMEVRIEVISIDVPGDYNRNGIVDAGDYSVWRDSLGQDIALPNEDPNTTPGQVTEEDYDFWKANFGNTGPVGPGPLLNTAVPEPASCGLLIVGIAAASVVGRRTTRPTRRTS